jgi:release factor glutamine methyltransferase
MIDCLTGSSKLKTRCRKNKAYSYIRNVFPKQLLSELTGQLSSMYDSEEANAIAIELVMFYSGCTKTELLLDTREVLPAALPSIYNAIPLILQHKPLQYVLGETWFYGLPFTVNEHVLIPRPETEELVELVLNNIAKQKLPSPQILDIGTGSGCIPIAIKKQLPTASVFGLDISVDALTVAKQNALRNGVDVSFMEYDILQPLTSNLQLPLFNIIVSNPPYITYAEKAAMENHVLAFEPHMALFVTDGNPMQFYEAIANFASTQLTSNGLLFVEINRQFGAEVKQTFEQYGFKNVVVHTDMHGNHRMVSAEYAA